MDGFVLAAVAVLALMAGFWAGRSLRWQMLEDETEREDPEEKEGVRMQGEDFEMPFIKEPVWDKRKKKESFRKIPLGKEIGSPAAGELSTFLENGRRVIRIMPKQGKVYAPASGRITRLYPMGSAMLLHTEFGADIMLRAGNHVDEMHSMYYRCRVMEHEVVRKGSLLLEYDPEALCKEGAEPEVTMSVENEENVTSMAVSSNTFTKAGETVLCIVSDKHRPTHENLF